MTDPRRTPANWERATALITQAPDVELQLLIDLVTDWELRWGRVISAAELREALRSPGR